MIPSENDDVTIVIPVWNGEKYIGHALDSILNQDYKNLYVIVSDNASSDRTAEIVMCYIPTGRVTYFRQKQNIGHIANFSFLIRQVRTPYYAFFCHDDYLCSIDAISQAHAVMRENPNVVAVFCDMLYVDRAGKKIARRKFRYTGEFSAELFFQKSIISGRNLFGIPLLIKTSIMIDFSYDSLLNYAADVEHAHFMGKRGALFHIAKPLIANRYHGSNLTRECYFDLYEQMAAMAKKHGLVLGFMESLLMRFNCWFVTLQKRIFFFYVESIRNH
jgi:glycosyltransferase involved in cell wall biosynthesis